jgi:transposase
MPNPYPIALRERAVRAYEAGTETYAEVAARFSIHLNTVVRWVQRARDRGTVLPAPRGGGSIARASAPWRSSARPTWRSSRPRAAPAPW